MHRLVSALRGLVACASLISTVGCGGGPSQGRAATTPPPSMPAPAPATASAAAGSGLDYESITLENSTDIVPALKLGSQTAGCTIVVEDGQGIAVNCSGGTLFVVQVGTELRWTCSDISKDECRTVLKRVIDAALNAQGS
jgi:hypothetical protein